MQDTITLEPRFPEGTEQIIAKFRSRFTSCVTRDEQLEVLRVTINSPEIKELTKDVQLTLRLFFELLEDLMLQEWTFKFTSGKLIARPPSVSLQSTKYKDPKDVKRRLRAALVAARNEQLAEPANQRFILEMERPRVYQGRTVSIQDLFVSGRELAADLEKRLNAPVEVREDLLNSFVQPYLQLVLPGKRDAFTNLRLSDIWRYCRYTWSLPFNSQPGRQMLYLVRDASREFHPIMGIGALASSVIQITCRDDDIGWTIDSLKREPCPNRLLALEHEIGRALDDVYWSDLLEKTDLDEPTDLTIDKLRRTIENDPPVNKTFHRPNDTQNLESETLSPLFRRKRATELAALLQAKRTFQDGIRRIPNPRERLKWLLSNEEGVSALKIALRSVKKRHVGSSIMDITTCGAIFPYSEILAGKLVSLLMASPIVVSQYRDTYSNAVSEIASKMKGESIVRPADLVLLATTSLYHVGSSQYNRLRCPVSQGELKFINVGKTDGFGSVHISNRTYRTLQELLRIHPKLKPESSVFAAGVNYKLRSISVGLRHLGLHRLARHRTPRLVYIVPLAKNYREYLGGVDENPDYIYDTLHDPYRETQQIIDYWKQRWLMPRLKRSQTLSRLQAASDRPVRVSELAGLRNTEASFRQTQLFNGHQTSSFDYGGGCGVMGMDGAKTLSWRTLAGLKDHSKSFAERLTTEELSALHIPTGLDNGLIDLIGAGKRVYLTGNPGDGKTHLIRRHEEFLKNCNALIILDASAKDDESLAREIELAITSGRPAVIAINEGILRRVLLRLPESEREQVKEQLDRPYRYSSERDGGNDYDAVVLNLGINQYLSRRVIDSILTILQHVDFSDAPESVVENVERIQVPRVRDRLQNLLLYVAQMGAHVTMHQVLGFFSYIVTGSRIDVNESETVLPYYDLCFDSENPLYRWLSELDPANISHPKWDAILWDGDPRREIQWISSSGIEGNRPVNLRDFESLKRRFFFESEQGDELLRLLPEDQQTYYDLLQNVSRAADTSKSRLIEALSTFFGGAVEIGDKDSLYIWSSHKYNAISPATAFISSYSIPPSKITIELPSIRSHVAQYLNYEPNHVRLKVRFDDLGSEVGLLVDFELWVALMQIKRGLAPRYHNPVISRRLQQFMSRLAAQSQKTPRPGLVRLFVRDIEAERTYSVQVSREERRFLFS